MGVKISKRYSPEWSPDSANETDTLSVPTVVLMVLGDVEDVAGGDCRKLNVNIL